MILDHRHANKCFLVELLWVSISTTRYMGKVNFAHLLSHLNVPLFQGNLGSFHFFGPMVIAVRFSH